MGPARDTRALVSTPENKEAGVFPRWLVVIVVVALVGYVLYSLQAVLTPVFFAVLIAYLLDPVVDRFEAVGCPRALGIVVVLGVGLGASVLFIVLVVPLILKDLGAFAVELPEKIDTLRGQVEPWLAQMGVAVPQNLDELIRQLDLQNVEVAERAIGPAGAVAGWLVGGTASMVGTVVGLLMVPVLAFYILYDFDRMTAAVADIIPRRIRPLVGSLAHEVDEMLGQFIRGQLTVMFTLAVLYSVGYSIVGVRLAVLIGIVAGLLAFIPYVGGLISLSLAILMTLLDWQGPWPLLMVIAVYASVQAVDGLFITPKILGGKVGLSPIWVLFALMVAGDVFGFMGVLLAVPAAAVCKIIVLRAVAAYRRSELYLAGAPGADALGVLLQDDVVGEEDNGADDGEGDDDDDAGKDTDDYDDAGKDTEGDDPPPTDGA